MSSIRAGSVSTKRSRREANAPSTASACPSRLPSPQPTAPSCVSTRTNNQRGGTRKVSILAIRFIRYSGDSAVLQRQQSFDLNLQQNVRKSRDAPCGPAEGPQLIRLPQISRPARAIQHGAVKLYLTE